MNIGIEQTNILTAQIYAQTYLAYFGTIPKIHYVIDYLIEYYSNTFDEGLIDMRCRLVLEYILSL